jgi:pantetheine-phosphate adenylyltransferase
MSKSIIYPGTFDPITNGHVDLIIRAAHIFDKVIVAVAKHAAKQTLLSFEAREALSREALKSLKNVEVVGFEGLLINFVRSQKVPLILRGIRAIADFEYERQLFSMNKALADEIDTIFMTPQEKHAHISSTFVRDIARLKGDVSAFVPSVVNEVLVKKCL